MKRRNLLYFVLIILLLAAVAARWKTRRAGRIQDFTQSVPGHEDADNTANSAVDDEGDVPAPVQASQGEISAAAHDSSALGGYNVLIADRGNNRILEVTPDKKIVWEYYFNLPKKGLGADDAFFTDNGASIIVNLEEYHLIQLIDVKSKTVTWSYGVPGTAGSQPGELNTPDDAYKLPNGDITVADIKNCRVLEIAPDKHIVRQYGQTKICGSGNNLLNKPNGDTPLANGHMLISNIVGRSLVELDQSWQPVFSMLLPVKYPSDPQMTKAGNILFADYSNPGHIAEVGKDQKVVWQFDGQAGEPKLNRPSLAIELPNGNILSNDDFNHRVIVIDKQTKRIVWQYGVTAKPGSGSGQLSIPDGVDIIPTQQGNDIAGAAVQNQPQDQTLSQAGTQASAPTTVGAVSRHAASYVNTNVAISGYVLARGSSYTIISDEPAGAVGYYDLPVTGAGLGDLKTGTKYVFMGVIKNAGLSASNHNPYHLELTQTPQ